MSLLMRRSSPVPQVTTLVHPVELPPPRTFPLWQVSYSRTAALKSATSEEARRNRHGLQACVKAAAEGCLDNRNRASPRKTPTPAASSPGV